jgi:hypothetical protein
MFFFHCMLLGHENKKQFVQVGAQNRPEVHLPGSGTKTVSRGWSGWKAHGDQTLVPLPFTQAK